MTNRCVNCGSPIPKSQTTCSMCYGDIAHGTDGYYEEWARRQQEEQEQQQEEER